jgi:hypothetical protein
VVSVTSRDGVRRGVTIVKNPYPTAGCCTC